MRVDENDRSRVDLCFVCLGNICRSPTAEGVMRQMLSEAGLTSLVGLDSAGTGDWHIGEPPDERAQIEASRRGIDISGLRGAQFRSGDEARFDLVLAMDSANLVDLRDRVAPSRRHRVLLLRAFSPAADPRLRPRPTLHAPPEIDHLAAVRDGADLEVPDPYFGSENGFETVFEMLEEACVGLIDHLRNTWETNRA